MLKLGPGRPGYGSLSLSRRILVSIQANTPQDEMASLVCHSSHDAYWGGGQYIIKQKFFHSRKRRDRFGDSKRISRHRREVGNDINPYFWKKPLQKQSLSNEQKF
jgi:hypothetical protein